MLRTFLGAALVAFVIVQIPQPVFAEEPKTKITQKKKTGTGKVFRNPAGSAAGQDSTVNALGTLSIGTLGVAVGVAAIIGIAIVAGASGGGSSAASTN